MLMNVEDCYLGGSGPLAEPMMSFTDFSSQIQQRRGSTVALAQILGEADEERAPIQDDEFDRTVPTLLDELSSSITNHGDGLVCVPSSDFFLGNSPEPQVEDTILLDTKPAMKSITRIQQQGTPTHTATKLVDILQLPPDTKPERLPEELAHLYENHLKEQKQQPTVALQQLQPENEESRKRRVKRKATKFEEPPMKKTETKSRPVKRQKNDTNNNTSYKNRTTPHTKRTSPPPRGTSPTQQVDAAELARLEKNRQSAKECRLRKKEYVANLERQVSMFQDREAKRSAELANVKAQLAKLQRDYAMLQQRMSQSK
eukprot:m.7050 g.7050  ORF g.7050 m.7050 type:complete len:315 (-) comp3641_c0_seq1:1669-2613(-)